MKDRLVLLDVGEQALTNADAGGLLIAPVSFKMGDSSASPNSFAPTDILGNFLCGGTINYVEVLSPRVSRFVLDIDTRLLTQPVVAKEAVLFLENNIALARCVFQIPYTIEPNEPVRFSALLTTTRADLSVLNVVVGDHESIPATPFVHRLPSPMDSMHNAISVLNGIRNPDGTNSPVMALRYGAGAMQWAFSDHTSVYRDLPASATSNSFRINTAVTFENNEQVIVHAVAGTGVGFTRRFRYNATNQQFENADSSVIPGLANTTIAVWKASRSTGNGGSSTIPPTVNIPGDWTLTPGNDGSLSWAPPKPAARVINTLYTAPSKLDVNALHFIGDGSEFRYSTGALIAENENFIYPAVGTITQHRTAFDLSASEVAFSDFIPAGVPVDLRVFTKSPSTGTRIEIVGREYVSDGVTTTFDLGAAPDSNAHVFMFVESLLQPTTVYSIDGNWLTVSAPAPAGARFEFRTITYVLDTAYSTRLVSRTYAIEGETFVLRLPTKPQSKEQVFVSESGAHVHMSSYEIVDDYVVFTSSLNTDIEVEVLMFENILAEGTENTNMRGIVTDAYTTSNSFVFLRHAAPPVQIPIPRPHFISGPGIKITGKWPQLKFEREVENTNSIVQKWSQARTEKNANSAVLTQRISFTKRTYVVVTCDYASALGPGFNSSEGREKFEFVIGVRSDVSREPDFGRRMPGTGESGFSSLSQQQADIAYTNASLTQIFELDPTTQPAGFVDIVAKARITNANTSMFETTISANLNILQFTVE